MARRRVLALLAAGACVLALATLLLVRLLAPAMPVPRPPSPSLDARHPAWPSPMGPVTVAGAVHVHTDEDSRDAHATREHVLDAAREAGFAYVVLADHDRPARPGEPQAWWHKGMLVFRGVEWSLDDGHLLDLGPPSTRTQFGLSRDAVADCRARGGPCVAAHPHAWRRQWLGSHLDLDGLEVHSAMAVLGDLVEPPFLRAGALAVGLLAAPAATLFLVGARQQRGVDLFAAHAQQKPAYAAWCGADVHGNVPVRENLLAFTSLVGLPAALDADAARAWKQLRDGLMRGATCANFTAGWVEGLSLQADAADVVAEARVPGGDAVKRALVLVHAGRDVVDVQVLPGATARAVAPSRGGAWEAQLRAVVDYPHGAVERVVATRLLQVDANASAR